MNNKEDFATLLRVYATIQPYRSPDFANEIVVTYWFNMFGQLSPATLKYAFDTWIKSNSHFPSISEFRGVLGAADPDPDVESKLMAARIMRAVASYGWNREKEAQKFLGEDAWSVVRGVGGWQYLSDLEIRNQSIVLAQMRDLARSILTQRRSPRNEANREALQSRAAEALDLVTGRTSATDKRIGNTNSNTSLVRRK